MPVSMATTQQHQQQQQVSQQQLQLHSIGIGGKTLQNDNKTAAAAAAAAVVMASKTISLLSAPHTPRLNYDGHEDDGQTGFLTLQENLVVTKTKTQPRNKKQSTSSTATTVSTTSIGSLELPAEAAKAIAAPMIASVTPSDSDNNSNDRNANLANSKKQTTTIGGGSTYKASHRSSSASTESHDAVAPHGRAHSHQSHYSTDKSGSSGYYSSNVCSTYSIEDHIYCEPVIDILDLNSKQKSKSGNIEIETAPRRLQQNKQHPHQALPQLPLTTLSGATVNLAGKALLTDNRLDSQTRTMNGGGRNGSNDTEGDEDESDGKAVAMRLRRMQQRRVAPQHFNDKLRVLETSIDNLDRHLKNFSSLSSQEHTVAYVQSQQPHQHYLPHEQGAEKLRLPYNHHLPTIMEGYDPVNQPRPWQHEIADDSLLDIDLDSFLLSNETKDTKRRIVGSPVGIDNPTFITDEVEENNYKCAKYINSCPENAYHVESDIVGTGSHGSASQKSLSAEHFLQRYEDQLHFQSTRELLEDVRDKIRILSQSSSDSRTTDSSEAATSNRSSLSHNSIDEKPTTSRQHSSSTESDEVPKELESMIKTLKSELESYLDRMNQHSEYEIRQLCSGLVKNDHIVKMKRAFERRRSVTEQDFYEAIEHGGVDALSAFRPGVPKNIRQQIASIRCASDPNFKMKRKSLCDVFPTVNCYMETANEQRRLEQAVSRMPQTQTQLQRNLSYHKPVLNQIEPIVLVTGNGKSNENVENHARKTGGAVSSGRNSTESGESGGGSGNGGDKDSILDWHRKKPSIWEQYYGTNRMHQSLLGKRNGMVVNNNQSSMSYPSSRPESDFTLDLPRAEQLRIKMEKEKKFRQRCRFITTLLSLIFFLLTVMVVSLVLTRGKRMFGSMI